MDLLMTHLGQLVLMAIQEEILVEEMGMEVDRLALMEILVVEVDHLVLVEILGEGVGRLVLVEILEVGVDRLVPVEILEEVVDHLVLEEILVAVVVHHHHLLLGVIQLHLHLEGEDDDLFINLIEILQNWKDSNLLLGIGELLLVLAKEREQFMMALEF